MTEEQTEVPEGIRVLEVKQEGDSLYVELASESRDELVNKGRTFALEMVGKTPKYAGWSRAGVEKTSSPVAFDPINDANDPYAATPNADTKWHYRQQLRITRSPV